MKIKEKNGDDRVEGEETEVIGNGDKEKERGVD